MRKISIILMLLVLLSGCSSMKFWKKSDNKIEKERLEKQAMDREKEERLRIDKIAKEIQAIQDDRDFYFGIGTADIKNEYSLARQKAKEQAMQELAKSIKIEVRSDMKKTLSNISIDNGKTYTEQQIETIEQQSNLYTDLVLNNIRFEEVYDDYPRKGVITTVVKKSVQEYDEKVKKQLRDNKQMINEFIQTANLEFLNGKYLNAIQNWQMAQTLSQSIFGGLPLFIDIDEDGFDEEINAYLNQRISSFFANIILEKNENSKICYDAQGSIDKKLSISAYYQDKTGKKTGIANLPLLITIIEGKAKIRNEVETGQYGQVEFLIDEIDASYSKTIVKFEVDVEKIKKEGKFVAIASSLTFTMEKMQTVGISISVSKNSQFSNTSNLMQTIKSSILYNGFSVVEINFNKKNLGPTDIETINKHNPDYFLNIYFDLTDGKTVGGYSNMFNAECSANISIYKMPTGNLKDSQSFNSEKGFGASAQNAQLNAFGKIVSMIEQKIQTILGKI